MELNSAKPAYPRDRNLASFTSEGRWAFTFVVVRFSGIFADAAIMTEIGLPTLRVTAGKVVFTHIPVIAGLASAFEICKKSSCFLTGAMS